MKPLDELRDSVRLVIDEWVLSGDTSTADLYDAIGAAIDTVEAEHPGLWDFTIHCDACGKPSDEGAAWDSVAPDEWFRDTKSGAWLCPSCYREAAE